MIGALIHHSLGGYDCLSGSLIGGVDQRGAVNSQATGYGLDPGWLKMTLQPAKSESEFHNKPAAIPVPAANVNATMAGSGFTFISTAEVSKGSD